MVLQTAASRWEGFRKYHEIRQNCKTNDKSKLGNRVASVSRPEYIMASGSNCWLLHITSCPLPPTVLLYLLTAHFTWAHCVPLAGGSRHVVPHNSVPALQISLCNCLHSPSSATCSNNSNPSYCCF